MSISISSAVIYGCYFNEIEDENLRKVVDRAMVDGELDYASPYYDADKSERFVGYKIPLRQLQPTEAIKKILETIDAANTDSAIIRALIDSGVMLVVNCSPHVM